jgi:hypothetical protein
MSRAGTLVNQTPVYPYTVALGHWARAIAEPDRTRYPYQALALLQQLALHGDPLADPLEVCIPRRWLVDALGNADADRCRVLLRQWVERGALRKLGRDSRGTRYLLLRPAIAELDDIARQQLVEYLQRQSSSAIEQQIAALLRPIDEAIEVVDDDAPPSETAPAKIDNAERVETLRRVDRQRSDVRDVLAKIARVPPNSLRYSGGHAAEVNSAIDWISRTHATWRYFESVCIAAARIVLADNAMERADLVWLFAPRNAELLTRALEAVAAKDVDDEQPNEDVFSLEPNATTDDEASNDPRIAELCAQHPGLTIAQAIEWLRE